MASISKGRLWAGYAMSGLPALALLASAGMKLANVLAVQEGFAHLGWPPNVIFGLGLVELTCFVLYLVPATSVLGAILVTGYLGGAMATHLRIGEPFIGPLLLGVLAWGGLYLRTPQLQALIPRLLR